MCSKKEIKPPCGLPYGSLPCTFNSRKDALSSSGRTNSQTEPPVLVICLYNMLPLFKVLTTFQLVPWPSKNGGGASTTSSPPPPSFFKRCWKYMPMVLGHIFMQVYLFSDIHIFFRMEAIMFRLGHTPGHMIRLVNKHTESCQNFGNGWVIMLGIHF